MSALTNRLPQYKWLQNTGLATVAIAFAYLLGRAALNPGNIRLLLAAALILFLVALSQWKPMAVVFLLIMSLPFLGLVRRLLIPVAGWSTTDPLVIVGPLAILFLATRWTYNTYILKQPIENDTALFRLIRLMLIFDLLQVFNPMQGSIATGMAGIMFYVAPVCYMIVGRSYLSEKAMKYILNTVLAIGLIASLYGYKHYWYGFASFETVWLELAGYTALNVSGVIRPISVFSSAAEYAHYLGVATTIGWIYVLKGKIPVKLICLPVIAVTYSALFIAAVRTSILTTTAAIAIVTIMSVRKTSHRALVAIITSVALAVTITAVSEIDSSDSLISHSVSGVTDPFNENSTTQLHIDLMMNGFKSGFTNPIGFGLGSTSIAAAKFNGVNVSSEVDLSNKFLATGAIGGIIYLLVMIRVLWLAVRNVHRSIVHLMILGVLLAEAGQWLMGGHYSIVGIIWLLIAYLDKTTAESNPRVTGGIVNEWKR